MSETNPWTYLMDMDGVLVTEEKIVPGADTFLAKLRENGNPFMVFTNNSIYTQRDLRARLAQTGLDIPEASIWTSALATAQFLEQQRPGGSAHVVGESGLTTALHGIGYVLTDRDPDYVVLGETRTYSFEAITKAIRLVEGGARFIATNPDEKGPSQEGTLPATGAVAALIERFAGMALEIPKADHFLRQWRNQQIHHETRNGTSRSVLAHKYGLSQRQIGNIRRTLG